MRHKVRIEPSGHEFQVEAGETVLDAALRQGFAFPYGCRNGACGSCKGKLLDGEVKYGAQLPPGLSDDDLARGFALFCSAVPAADLVIEVREIGAAKDIPVKTLPCRVAKLERLNHDVMRMSLKLPATERLQYLAGQYIDVLLKDGRRRSFSIANAPHDDQFLELHVRHVPGGRFTDEVFGSLKEKAILRFEGPLGSFFLREDSNRPIILMAGGTGFAPLKGIVEHAIAEGMTRPMHLYWGARAREDLYLHDLALGWVQQHTNIQYTPVLSEPMPGDGWEGRTGYVHEAILADHADLSEYEIYASGPPAMIAAGREQFPSHGLSLDNFYCDSFEYAKD